ncbi:MAG: hypothetical protein Q4B67_07900 [Eubacteriales bacterium]|nr:hypothetical protein [Eubacteriales bacterium]
MKFLHLSDARLGIHSESGRRWSNERIIEVTDTLRKTVHQAAAEGIQLVLIAGGLFAHRPVSTELAEANNIFSAYPELTFVIIAGETDCIKSNSPVRSFKWAKNVRYVLSGRPEQIIIPALKTVVYAESFTGNRANVSDLLMAGRQDTNEGYSKIALFYEPEPEKAGELDFSAFSYVALGGRKGYYMLSDDKAYYPGGLEPEEMSDGGEHGYIKGDIDTDTGLLTETIFVPAASASYVPLRVTVNTDTTATELEGIIENEIRRRGRSNIYRIRILGKRSPETIFTLDTLKSRYRITDVSDETEPQYDFAAIYEEHPQDIIGYFISTLTRNREDMPDIDKKAMFYGIDALLKTSENGEVKK